MSFCVICKDIKDCTLLYYRGRNEQKDIEKSRFSGGFVNAPIKINKLRGAITVVNASEFEKDSSYIESARIHEERHILYRLTKETEELGDYSKFLKERENEIEKNSTK